MSQLSDISGVDWFIIICTLIQQYVQHWINIDSLKTHWEMIRNINKNIPSSISDVIWSMHDNVFFNYCLLGNFLLLFGRLLNFFKLFRKILSGIPTGRHTVWIQIRPDILSGLIWVQTVCKGYQQTTLVGKELPLIYCHLLIQMRFWLHVFVSWKQTLWTLIRLLQREQSDLGPYCLQYRLTKKYKIRWANRWQLLQMAKKDSWFYNGISNYKIWDIPSILWSKE